jgi:hypothetical protein
MQNNVKRETIEYIIVLVALIIAIGIAVLTLPRKGDVVVYNCSLSEISPDFPPEVREQCRKLRAETVK